MYPRSMADSDCIVIMGSNMAENHPVAFRWPMKAKVEHGAKLIHVDPRFTRTSAVADIYAPVRAGSDIAFLGGLINYVINSETLEHGSVLPLVGGELHQRGHDHQRDSQDTEDNDGVFSGLMEYKGGVPEWPYNGFAGQYDDESWQYARDADRRSGPRSASTAQSGRSAGHDIRRRSRRLPPKPLARRTSRSSGRCSSRRRRATRRCRIRAASSRSSSGISAATRRRWSSASPAARATPS